ncbi:RIO1 family regulatory kinase/ATPase [Nocardioides convexus]|nr:RIO1 family regulatory kinase/ATPase [Nocardioides convexus]
MATLVQAGLVHGDLSPYNILAAGERLVVIDLPQARGPGRQRPGLRLPAA